MFQLNAQLEILRCKLVIILRVFLRKDLIFDETGILIDVQHLNLEKKKKNFKNLYRQNLN